MRTCFAPARVAAATSWPSPALLSADRVVAFRPPDHGQPYSQGRLDDGHAPRRVIIVVPEDPWHLHLLAQRPADPSRVPAPESGKDLEKTLSPVRHRRDVTVPPCRGCGGFYSRCRVTCRKRATVLIGGGKEAWHTVETMTCFGPAPGPLAHVDEARAHRRSGPRTRFHRPKSARSRPSPAPATTAGWLAGRLPPPAIRRRDGPRLLNETVDHRGAQALANDGLFADQVVDPGGVLERPRGSNDLFHAGLSSSRYTWVKPTGRPSSSTMNISVGS